MTRPRRPRMHRIDGEPASAAVPPKTDAYAAVLQNIRGAVSGETDEIAVMATVVCELYHGLEHVDWVGFYRVTAPGVLKVGPYQGGHGCLTIPFTAGVCGRCAREARTQIVADVRQDAAHIACATSTRSEIVVPVLDPDGCLRSVLDVDSDTLAAFDEVDATALEQVCSWVGRVFVLGGEGLRGPWNATDP